MEGEKEKKKIIIKKTVHEWHLQSEFRFENWYEYSLVGLFSIS